MVFASDLVKACWVVLIIYWLLSARGNYKTKQRVPVCFLMAAATIAVAVVGSLIMALTHTHRQAVVLPHSTFTEVLGATLAAAGTSFAIWARRVIGKNWSGDVTLKEGHELITSGPYALVRHPIYTGILTMLVGSAIVFGTAPSFIYTLAVTVGLSIKLQAEERLMLQNFGERYEEYRQHTKAIIPKVI